MENEVDLARRAFGLSQDAQLAALLDVIPQAVHNWRRKNQIPPARRLQLATLLRSAERDVPEWMQRLPNSETHPAARTSPEAA